MQRFLLTIATTFVVAVGATSVASIFPDDIGNGSNVFQDQSRENFIDVDGGGTLNKGDVILGFARVDDQNQPPNGPINNQLYVILSQQFAADPTVVATVGTKTIYSFSFEPTTAAGLTLSDLLGGLDPGGISEGMFALVQKSTQFSKNLVTEAPNAAPTMADFLNLLTTEGSLVGVAGIAAGSDDAFNGTTGLLESAAGASENDFVKDLTVFTTNPQNFQGVDNLADYEAGLSIIYNAFPQIQYNEVVNSSFGTHQLVASGPVNGALNLPNTFGGTDYFPFAFSDRVDFEFNATVVPEPSSIVAWGLLSLISLCGLTSVRGPRARN